MKAAIYNPYWDILGGGERYVASVVKYLDDNGYDVDIWWPEDITQKIKDRFGIILNDVHFLPFDPVKVSFFDRIYKTSQYDLIFWVSDGSIPLSLAKKTIIHMQIPAHWKGCDTWPNRIKAKKYIFVCNSNFTKSVIDKIYGINSQVIYPLVGIKNFTALPKQNVIVSIGRLAHLLHAKRQDVLIKAFSRLSQRLPGWKLILAGGSEDAEYIKNLNSLIKKLPIEIIKNPSFVQIRELLGKAKIFWSATGYGVNIKLFPEKAEHFGITTVEAMAAGCVPIVTDSGGHLETVRPGENGYLWHTIEQLNSQTLSLINDENLYNQLQKTAIADSQKYSIEKFNDNLSKII